MTDLAAERPDDFELATAWERVVDEVEQRRSLLSWRRCSSRTGSCRCCATSSAGTATSRAAFDHRRVRVRVAAPTPLDIARNLAGWGALIEVLEPPSVQAELARLGAELIARYK